MEVLKRSQITEVRTVRSVYHTLKLNDLVYNRIETLTTYLPNMGCDLINHKKL